MQIRRRSHGWPRLTLGQSIGRYFGTYLSAIILSIGFIMAGLRATSGRSTIFSPAHASSACSRC